MERFIGLLGVLVFLAVACAMSTDRKRISPRIVLGGLGLQFALAFLLIRFDPVVGVFEKVAQFVNGIISASYAGSAFIFGGLSDPGAGAWGFVFAFRVLPIIIFFASFMAVLYHWGIMQRLVAALAWLLRKTMGVTGAEAMSMAANVFVGQTEAPLCVKPFIPKMTQSQLMALMTGGFATIAGSVLAAYVGMLGGVEEAQQVLFAKHLLTASLLSAPAAFVIAKIMVPETQEPPDESIPVEHEERSTRNVLDAAAAGATDGLKLALNVAAMLVAFVALLALVNWPLEAFGRWQPIADWRAAAGVGDLSLELILGWLFMPVAWVMGVEWGDCGLFGTLLGQKLVVTEFIAYGSLADAIHADGGSLISPRTAQLAAFALCGFANFPSIAIQIGGLTAIAPSRRSDFASLGLKAMFAGAMASWMTACIAGLFI